MAFWPWAETSLLITPLEHGLGRPLQRSCGPAACSTVRCSEEAIRSLLGGSLRASAQEGSCPLGSGGSLGRGQGCHVAPPQEAALTLRGLEDEQEWPLCEAHTTQLFFPSCPAGLQSRRGPWSLALQGGLQASVGP